MEYYIMRAGKKLRCGYTTGSCAAAAAKAATAMLLSGAAPERSDIDTPKGVALSLNIENAESGDGWASCAVRKDGGDDPDATNGFLVYARVQKRDEGIVIEGGEGVGRVTKPGLDQPVGAAAINSTPRRMIEKACREVCAVGGYKGGLLIVVSIPGGDELAKRTFNPRIGIEGGLSVIGTSGIVEPMSSAALVDTIQLELRVNREAGEPGALLIPGNYGEAFAAGILGLKEAKYVICSNFIGDAIDASVFCGFEKILLIGHIGKLVKLGIGMFNTHSAFGDGRMETLAACAAEVGADVKTICSILHCATTDAALDTMKASGVLSSAMAVLGARIDVSISRKVPPGTDIGFICFTNSKNLRGILTQSPNADGLLALWKGN